MRKIDVTQRGGARGIRAEIAQDTLKRIKNRFGDEIEASFLCNEEYGFVYPGANDEKQVACNISVTSQTTLEALYSCRDGAHVVVLNFASAKNPGGGFQKGSSAQEESLARSSSLYNSLVKFKKPFYEYNRKFPGVYSNRIIVSPKITFLKSDEGKKLDVPIVAAVITAPAVNAGVAKCSAKEVNDQMKERMRRILSIAFERKWTTLILGAFGCGVFKNDPRDVAEMWRQLLTEEFASCFKEIVFACYGPKENLLAFKKTFDE